MKHYLIGFLMVFGAAAATAGERVLDGKLHHLRSGVEREWTDFPQEAEGGKLVVSFAAAKNESEQTLRLRHRDVKRGWQVALNGKLLGRLERDENDMVVLWPLPPGALLDGANKLEISSADEPSDDVMIGDVRLIDRSVDAATRQAMIDVAVTDATGGALPCRLTIVDKNGSLTPLGAVSSDRLAVRTGMIYTADGRARFGVAAGRYTIYATRGTEYGLDQIEIDVEAGKTATGQLRLAHEMPTPGYVSCDTHVHTFTFSRHGDASVEERMISIVGEGLELPIATDHNIHTDYQPYAKKLGLSRYFTPVIGNEVTTRVGHFNVFPIERGAAPPDTKSTDWPTIFSGIYATPGVQVAILNHGRDLHGGYRPFDSQHHNAVTAENLDDWQLKANAMEVVNSAALQSDPLQLYHDWFALLNRGLKITPVGGSDSHEVARKLVAQGRTYIRCDDGDPGNIDVAEAVQSFLAGRVLVSMGLLTEMTVEERFGPGDVAQVEGMLDVKVRVRGPSWTAAERVVLFANGVPIREAKIASQDKPRVLKWSGTWQIARPQHDQYLVAVALGPGVTAPFWRIPRSYQPTSTVWKPYVIGSTGAVWIDADSDGRATCARDYALEILRSTGDDLDKLLAKLADYDEVVAAHCAGELARRGKSPLDGELTAALKQAAPATQAGFRRFTAAWRESQAARARQ